MTSSPLVPLIDVRCCWVVKVESVVAADTAAEPYTSCPPDASAVVRLLETPSSSISRTAAVTLPNDVPLLSDLGGDPLACGVAASGCLNSARVLWSSSLLSKSATPFSVESCGAGGMGGGWTGVSSSA